MDSAIYFLHGRFVLRRFGVKAQLVCLIVRTTVSSLNQRPTESLLVGSQGGHLDHPHPVPLPQLRFVAGRGTQVARTLLPADDVLFDPMMPRQAIAVVIDRRVGSLSQSWERDRVRVKVGPRRADRRQLYPLSLRISSTRWGRISRQSPTTPNRADAKMSASSSVLIATIVLALPQPAMCWPAPDMPRAK